MVKISPNQQISLTPLCTLILVSFSSTNRNYSSTYHVPDPRISMQDGTGTKDITSLVSYLNKKDFEDDFEDETLSQKFILLRATTGKAMHLYFN